MSRCRNISDKIAINKAFPIATNKGFNFNKGVEPLSFCSSCEYYRW